MAARTKSEFFISILFALQAVSIATKEYSLGDMGISMIALDQKTSNKQIFPLQIADILI
jgi:hypothetical protein